MAKTALENAQELLESLEGSFERKREKRRGGHWLGCCSSKRAT